MAPAPTLYLSTHLVRRVVFRYSEVLHRSTQSVPSICPIPAPVPGHANVFPRFNGNLMMRWRRHMDRGVPAYTWRQNGEVKS